MVELILGTIFIVVVMAVSVLIALALKAVSEAGRWVCRKACAALGCQLCKEPARRSPLDWRETGEIDRVL